MAIPMAAAKKPPRPPPDDPPADPAISYLVDKGRNDHLMVMNADGSNQASIFSTGDISHQTWAPDGNAIAVMAKAEDYTYSLVRIDITIVDGVPQGGNPIELAQDISWSPAWSPAGDVIAFPKKVDGITKIIQTVPADGGTVETIYTAPEGLHVSHVTWRADASKIAFIQAGGGQRTIQVMDLSDGSTTTVFGPVGYALGFLHWARTKDVLLYICSSPTEPGIYTLDLTEPSPTPQHVFGDSSSNYSPCWSPDDTQMVIHLVIKNSLNICVYTFESGEIESLAKGFGYPEWSRA
jgi:Tol biopolymer transport system component